jgi:hypothetical protein
VKRTAKSEEQQVINSALANTYEVALSVEPDWQQVCVRERLDRPYTHDATSPEFDCSRPTHRRMLGIVAIANGYGRQRLCCLAELL